MAQPSPPAQPHAAQKPQLSDIAAATGLLTRLPVRVNEAQATARGACAAWAYPFAGLAVGIFACLIGEAALWADLSATLAAGLALATLIILTGALHEDGFADTADGFWGGWDKNNRLKIMKDSHIGTYGTLALVLGVGLRWQTLALVIDAGLLWPAILTVAVLSRASMVAIMAALPFARKTGLSRAVGRPELSTALIAISLSILTAVLFFQITAIWLIAAAGLATVGCGALARAKIGGQTGDILGATQQISEIVLLLTLVAML